MSTHVTAEIASQPACWRRAAETADREAARLPRRGERVAVVGCGTSYFIARAYAALRESLGAGETDAFPASDRTPLGRGYDRIVALTRSGTTTEVVNLLAGAAGRIPTVVLTGVPDSPAGRLADETVDLAFADERSVVQTRFATTALQLLRAGLGVDLAPAIADAELVLYERLPAVWERRGQFTFLGTGWTVGLADEAALKVREVARAWTESYAAMEYRHGPISISDRTSLVCCLGPAPSGLRDEVESTGALFAADAIDPVAALVRAQRLAVALADRRGLNPDRPRHVSRSVILAGAFRPTVSDATRILRS
ncbi:SIS domain-containing protein [Streptomyces gardneri]|uniref:SIS domain-containing protein n=1 Tax=Streptomyces gardneri TaxID=66892 RepID=UPI0006BD5741|nr:SIS domain-containing protein [Streptomyces gardneri]QPK49569.1 SIS domain-containing protein [Streptomyces gardneri]WRK41113.1 SIS domain-containing protein [Streptomyces venezuelae]CUM36481.1 Glucosamine-6-phosphate deaminase [isomerizing], alternative [Streptomyces venezuelae]